jgi:hypothetical protein
MLEVSVVNVGVHSKETLEDHFYYVHEVAREGHAQRARKHLLIVQLRLHPRHQEVDVLCGGHLQRRLHVLPVRPQILVLGARAHGRTGLSGAKLSQNAVQHVDLVVKFNSVHGEPFVQILASWQFDRYLHITAAECHPRDLLQTIATSAFANLLLLLEGFSFINACHMRPRLNLLIHIRLLDLDIIVLRSFFIYHFKFKLLIYTTIKHPHNFALTILTGTSV